MPHLLTSSLTSPYTLQSISINRNFSTKHGAPPVEPILRNVPVVTPASAADEEPLKWGKVQKMAIDDGKGEDRLVSARHHPCIGEERLKANARVIWFEGRARSFDFPAQSDCTALATTERRRRGDVVGIVECIDSEDV
jgi:hypothetical protein